jgi:hypothetical protein|nr:MAG TPA_asm: capsid fiber protein [Caudoviricetes sp.]
MNAYEIPSLRFSLPAGGAVERHRFVAVDANSNGIQAVADSNIIGASMNKTSAGQVLEIADGIVMVEAAKAVTAGKIAYADADGKVTDTGTVAAGIVITSAVAGGLAAVKIN